MKLAGVNGFSGTYQADSSLLVFAGSNTLNGAPNVVILGDANSGIVLGDSFANGVATIGSLSGSGGKVRVDWANPTGTRTLSVNQTTDGTYAGSIQNGGADRRLALIKTGTGTLVLSGNNGYSGGTSVEAGTLIFSGGDALEDGTGLTVGASGSMLFAPFLPAEASSPPRPAQAVPEPATPWLLLVAACVWAACRSVFRLLIRTLKSLMLMSSRFLRAALARPLAVSAIVILAMHASLQASGGSANVLLVVNALSPDSLRVANHYAALRHIPGNNFLFLEWDPKKTTTDVDTFREKILQPVIRAAKLPVPGRRIDYVVYSCDFPWSITIHSDIQRFKAFYEKQGQGKTGKPDAKDQSWITYVTPVASINGLTYLWEPVLNNSFYVHPQCNWYARTGAPEQAGEPTLSFSSASGFGPNGEVAALAGRHYVLSMMLGVTSGRGNTVEEVLAYLARSAAADGRRPRGTIYFVQNDDIRSKVRQNLFPRAVKELKALGVAAEILQGNLPERKNDVQGAMLGLASFDWPASGSTILPGAICEHFTSFGGDLNSSAGQTPLSVLLRAGAAAASGTVTEPYSIPNKFPTATMHVHYARGCTAAEAFYQSVQCPYQLLIVGDPLCRPWADIPEITFRGLAAGDTVRGEVKITPQARFAGGAELDHFELLLDGMKIRECGAGGSLEFHSANLADGSHELRVAAVSRGPVQSRGEKIVQFTSANHDRSIVATCEPEKTLPAGGTLRIKVKSPDSASIRILVGTRLLGSIPGTVGEVEIPAARLGRGPVRIQAVGLGAGGPTTHVFAPPLNIVVDE